MLSEDESRILYPKHATEKDQERGGVHFSFEYANRDVMLTLIEARNKSLGPQSDWILNMQELWGGARREVDRFKYRIHPQGA